MANSRVQVIVNGPSVKLPEYVKMHGGYFQMAGSTLMTYADIDDSKLDDLRKVGGVVAVIPEEIESPTGIGSGPIARNQGGAC